MSRADRTPSSGQPEVLAPPSPAAIRAELEAKLLANILGPEGGEHEEVDASQVHEHYLVGMLAPRSRGEPDASEFDGQQDPPVVEGPADLEEPSPDVGVAATGPSLFPSSVGLTTGVDGQVTGLVLEARWGRYQRVTLEAEDGGSGPKRVWRRTPAGGRCPLALAEGEFGPLVPDPDQAGVVLRGRLRRSQDGWVLTVFLVNDQEEQRSHKDEAWLFQVEVAVNAPAGEAAFRRTSDLEPAGAGEADEEARGLDMAYRDHVQLAVGHGTGVHAEVDRSDPRRATRIVTRAVPAAEVPRTEAPSPAERPELAGVVLDMATLARAGDEALAAGLRPLVEAYRGWIEDQRGRLGRREERLGGFEETARSALAGAERAAARMEAGIDLLDPTCPSHDPGAAEAFRFANRAMWQQRVRTQLAEARMADPELDPASALERFHRPEHHSWRPFQLGFVLLNLPSLADPGHPERGPGDQGVVDLLWFPTGGGKTEAYLGLAAFTLAIRRLQGHVGGRDGSDGVGVLMRYTLRLLTVQQFQRAAALICACEMIRREAAAAGDHRWGQVPFRLGLWVGAKVTPTNNMQAERALREARGTSWHAGGGASPVQVTACPWCGSPVDPGRDAEVDSLVGRTLVYCGDPLGRCPFSRREAPREGLPLVTVDHEIYRLVPAMVIATADKFAQLSWEGATRALFGRVTRRCTRHGYRHPDLDQRLDERDSHLRRAPYPEAATIDVDPLRPPDLVIQDELHLIAGPLGSLMGLYEAAIDHLCTWEVGGRPVRPKVVASTATVRRAAAQARQVFWRSLEVFPPPGLDAADSFFAVQRDPEDAPGRRYLGVCAPGRRIKAVEIRLYVALLGAAQSLFERYGAAVDPWMTLVGYFSAMRELAGMRRMVDDDVSTRLAQDAIVARGLARRRLGQPQELTSRMDSAEIPQVLDRLRLAFAPGAGTGSGLRGGGAGSGAAGRDGSGLAGGRSQGQPARGRPELRAVDVLLATNMISVGVDVPRLGLMVVGGQPKATAEYIQATSRVGRSNEGPGLVVTALNWARPRDLSHYETFEHFHATFYRHVEALSVTPFSPRCLDRGLSGVAVSMVRQSSEAANANAAAQTIDPAAVAAGAGVVEAIRARAEALTSRPEVGEAVAAGLAHRFDSWLAHQRRESSTLGYRQRRDGQTVGLLRSPGDGPWRLWTSPTSLREVEPGINLLLVGEDGGGGGGDGGGDGGPDYELPGAGAGAVPSDGPARP